MHEIYRKKYCYGPVMIKPLIVNNLVNNKVRDLIFGYVIAVIMVAMSIYFLRNHGVL